MRPSNHPIGWICDSCDILNKCNQYDIRKCVNCGYQDRRGEKKNLTLYLWHGRRLTARQHADIQGISADAFRAKFKRHAKLKSLL